jgi:hypothetical protein
MDNSLANISKELLSVEVKKRLQPDFAKSVAIALPIPPVAPEINAPLPLSISISNIFKSLYFFKILKPSNQKKKKKRISFIKILETKPGVKSILFFLTNTRFFDSNC